MEEPLQQQGWEACAFCQAASKNTIMGQQQQQQRKFQSRLIVPVGCGYITTILGHTLKYCSIHRDDAHRVALSLINLHRIRPDDDNQEHYHRIYQLYQQYIPKFLP